HMSPQQLTEDPALDVRARYAQALIGAGRPDDALALVEPLRKTDPNAPLSYDLAAAFATLASTYNTLQRSEDALALTEVWRGPVDRAFGTRSIPAARLAVEQATALLALGRAAEAERASEQALESYIERNGADGYDTADVRVLHGQALLARGQLDAARAEI